ncbi:2-isopropylmalate synthase [Thermanaerovibrio acidaminovorans]|uniref:2-isopropylmalate synthase n=1 Tax=Thermanaerovibrio acidaminovorans TaxID=81462 RepID=UPI0024932A50|nr:2-isopropylmalate synthase [Thermanaerovibrio acidaminovorans]
MTRRIRIFDTTLRDGEQAAGVNLNLHEKVQIAQRLDAMKVDVIEAGFPAASDGDMEAVRAVARIARHAAVAGLARTRENDILRAFEALKGALRPRIHVFIATSPIHMEHKLKLSPREVLEEIRRGVTLARSLVEDVEFSAEDASRSEIPFLKEAFSLAIQCGATTLNIPDTVGYAEPSEFGQFVHSVMEAVGAGDSVTWSVHCHDDLGLAVANSLAAVMAGANQVECTVNGLGERAGNASLEEVVMALRTRRDLFKAETGISTPLLYPTSRLVSRLTGIPVPPNKAIVGDNAFAHESGIHQHGVLSKRETYEIMDPRDVGAPSSSLILGKHSGSHAFRERLNEMGYNLSEEDFKAAFKLFKDLCDRKKTVTDQDIEAIVADRLVTLPETCVYELVNFSVQAASDMASATVTLKVQGEEHTDAAAGNGPVEAAYRAIDRITGLSPDLKEFRISAVSGSSDSLGEASVEISLEGRAALGRWASTDVIEAAIGAYVNALNRLSLLGVTSNG